MAKEVKEEKTFEESLVELESIVKELEIFREKFKDFCKEQNIILPIVTLEDVKLPEDII